MSEPPHQAEYDFNYWMNADLMDACFDPMHDGMGLDRFGMSHPKEARQPLESNPGERAAETVWPTFDELNISPYTSQHQSTGWGLSLSPSLDEGSYLQINNDSAFMDVIQGKAASRSLAIDEYHCQICGKKSSSVFGLSCHAKDTGHLAFACSFSGCLQTFVSYEEKEAHERRPHTTGHGRTVTTTPFDCVECGGSFSSKANLLRHAKERQHQPYSCECGAVFSRLDVLNRHLESVGTERPKYPCKFCKRHRGPNGFRRLDHLRQHERNYHHLEMADDSTDVPTSRLTYYFPVCSHSECPHDRDESFKTLPRSTQAATKPFSTQAAFTKHMREEHSECTFPCDVSGCTRVARRGYFREKDLIKHRRESHPDAPPYQPTERELWGSTGSFLVALAQQLELRCA